MAEAVTLVGGVLAGGALGALFFGGLFWTVRRSLTAWHPALWVFASLMLRTFVVLAGFYLVGQGEWPRILACLTGFVVARTMALHIAQREQSLRRHSEAARASES